MRVGAQFLYGILVSPLYDSIMMVVIVLNTLWMATEHWPGTGLVPVSHRKRRKVDGLVPAMAKVDGATRS